MLVGLDLLIALLVCSSAVVLLATQYVLERTSIAAAASNASDAVASNSSLQEAIYASYATGAWAAEGYAIGAAAGPGARLVSFNGVLRPVSVVR